MPFHNDLWQGNQAVAAFYWRREGNLITDHLSTRIYHICVSLFCFFALTWFLIVIGFLICMDTKIWTQIDCLWSGDVFSVDSCLDSFPEFIYFWSVKCTQFNIFKQQRVKPLLQWKMRHHGDFLITGIMLSRCSCCNLLPALVSDQNGPWDGLSA